MTQQQKVSDGDVTAIAFGRRRVRPTPQAEAPNILNWETVDRAASIAFTPVNLAAFGLSVLVMQAGAMLAIVPYLVLFGLFVRVLGHVDAAAPRTLAAHILRALPKYEDDRATERPDAHHAGRAVSARPVVSVIPPLPPDRPRTRISERRPGPDDASD
jgi:hypothetical protein